MPFQLPAWFDLGATFAFALAGALAGIKRGYDIVGIFFLALVSGIGGGLIRDSIFIPSATATPLLTDSRYIQLIAAATVFGVLFGRYVKRFYRVVALIDALDMLDVESAASAGVELDRLLWIRGHVVTNQGLCRELNQRAIEQAIRAFTLVLQAGNFGLVVFDVAEAPADAVRRLPFTTWLRLQRMVEGRQTACLLVGGESMARSSAGLTLRLAAGNRDSRAGIGDSRAGIGDSGLGIRFGGLLFDGLDVQARVVRARAREQEEACVALSTSA